MAVARLYEQESPGLLVTPIVKRLNAVRADGRSGLGVRGKIVFNQGEITGNIWMREIR